MNSISDIKPIIAPLLLPAVCLIIGIVAGRFVSCPVGYALGALMLTLLLTFLCSRWSRLQSLLVCLSCMSLGTLLCLHQKSQLEIAWPEEAGNYALVISSEPVERGKTLSMDALLATTGQKIQLRLMRGERSRQLHVGDGLVIFSAIKPLSAQGSYRTWQETHGYVGEAFVWRNHWQRDNVSLADIGHLQRLRLYFMGLRRQLLAHLSQHVSQRDDYSILAAMTLGDKSAVSREQKEQFSIAGTSHLLALSGLHLGIIYMLLTSLFRSRRWQLVNQLLIVSSVWAFVLLVGMPSSVVRAAVMITVYAVVSLLNRSKTPVNTLALTAILMLVSNPYALFDVGFQLSFSAVLAILLFMPLFNNLFTLPSWLSPLWKTTAVTVAAQLGTAPLVAYYFGRFSLWFLLANFLAIHLATLILYTMLLTLLLSFWPAAQSVVIILPATLASWLNSWTSWIASLPLASIDGLRPTVLQVALLYIIVACLWYLLRYYVKHTFLSNRL